MPRRGRKAGGKAGAKGGRATSPAPPQTRARSRATPARVNGASNGATNGHGHGHGGKAAGRARSGTGASSVSSGSSRSEEDELEHEQALAAVRNLDTVKQALQSALGNIERLEPRNSDDDGSDGSDMNSIEGLADANRRVKALRSSVIEAVDRGVAEITEVMQGQLQRLATDIKSCVKSASAEVSAAALAKARRRRLFGEKRFKARSSVLSNMLRDRDFQTIYNICVAALVWLAISIVVEEQSRSAPWFDISMMLWSFSKANVVIVAWWCMFLTTFSIVWLVQTIKVNALPMRVWVWPYVAIQTAVVTMGMYAAMHNELPPASGFIVMCESARMFMKMHAYLREKLLHGTDNQYRTFIPGYARKAGVTVQDLALPSITIGDMQTELSRFMYFMFCPSLVYRDQFPRTRRVRWAKVVSHMLNVVAAVVFTFVIFRAFCAPHFQETASSPQDVRTFVRSVFYSMVPSMIVFIMAFFGVLHSWFNMWAELLTYADREFYTDWWNARSFGAYYRKWNVVVHEWLYYYLYLDSIRFSKGSIGKGGATSIVFIISALFHEWIIMGAVRFWYPVLLVMFGGPGVIFMQLQKKSEARFFNIFMWMMLSVGMGLLLVLYSREWYARFGGYHFSELEFPKSGFVHYALPQSWPAAFYETKPVRWMLGH